jgi:hypothetical protein
MAKADLLLIAADIEEECEILMTTNESPLEVYDDPKAELQRIDTIANMIADPEVALADISRLIALEIVEVVRNMARNQKDPLARGTYTQKELTDQIKALRELQRTLTESDSLSKKDVLNMDGPKFKFLFTELIRLFRLALKDSGTDEDLARNVMLQFGDLVKSHDEGIRRDLNKIESGR